MVLWDSLRFSETPSWRCFSKTILWVRVLSLRNQHLEHLEHSEQFHWELMNRYPWCKASESLRARKTSQWFEGTKRSMIKDLQISLSHNALFQSIFSQSSKIAFQKHHRSWELSGRWISLLGNSITTNSITTNSITTNHTSLAFSDWNFDATTFSYRKLVHCLIARLYPICWSHLASLLASKHDIAGIMRSKWLKIKNKHKKRAKCDCE